MINLVRKAIRQRRVTLYQIAKGSGVAYPVVHRFVHHHGLPALPAFEKLCAYLGATLTIPEPRQEIPRSKKA
jgi:hypothetical protein